ncbi:MAG: hypothetical protein AB8U16_00950 [Rickettsiales endosymbiont of Dermacentor nuttalli]
MFQSFSEYIKQGYVIVKETKVNTVNNHIEYQEIIQDEKAKHFGQS